jgi:hypothetical protein
VLMRVAVREVRLEGALNSFSTSALRGGLLTPFICRWLAPPVAYSVSSKMIYD